MKLRAALLFLAAFTAVCELTAAPPPTSQLRTYLEDSFARCPDGKIQMKRQASSPRGFLAYKVRLTSSAPECGREADLLVSSAGKQVLFVNVFTLPTDSRPLDVRLADFGQSMLRKSVRVAIGKSVLEDGLRDVIFFTNGKVGPFELHGYTDASGSFLIVGRRGHLNVDPRTSLLADLPPSVLRRGREDAPIRIMEISDLQCPTCKQAHELLTRFVEANPDRVSYARIDLPIFDIHDWTLSASLAARAIQRLSPQHYWQFVDYVFENQSTINSSSVDTFIHDFVDGKGIDREKFDALYNSPSEKAALVHQIEHLFDVSIAAAPTVLVNGQEIFFGSQGSYLRSYLEALLAGGK